MSTLCGRQGAPQAEDLDNHHVHCWPSTVRHIPLFKDISRFINFSFKYKVILLRANGIGHVMWVFLPTTRVGRVILKFEISRWVFLGREGTKKNWWRQCTYLAVCSLGPEGCGGKDTRYISESTQEAILLLITKTKAQKKSFMYGMLPKGQALALHLLRWSWLNFHWTLGQPLPTSLWKMLF